MRSVVGRRRVLVALLIAPLYWGGATAHSVAQPARTVVVNGVPISPQHLSELERVYGVPVPNGRYWYDPYSGAWGVEGGPTQGQIHPGLALGGPLRPDASRGTTRVFVNGRELHVLDVRGLQRCTAVIPGRYWMDARGVGGYEGGPPIFDLSQLCARARAGGGSTQTECAGAGCQSTNHRTGIGVITEGNGRGAVFIPGGGMIMTPN